MNKQGVILCIFILGFVVYLCWSFAQQRRGGKRQTVFTEALPYSSLPALNHLPKRFDWREHGLEFTAPDQGSCGACWAWAAVIPLEKRFHLAKAQVPPLSAQYLLNCQAYCSNPLNAESCDDGCEGGLVDHSWLFLQQYGTPAAAEVPFNGANNQCNELPSGTRLYKAQQVYRVQPHVDAIKQEIIQRGPVSAGMEAYKDLLSSDGASVYEYDGQSESLGGHAVVLVGWDDAERAWYALNVWGSGYGDKGFFKIRMGRNECGIESGVVAGLPKVG